MTLSRRLRVGLAVAGVLLALAGGVLYGMARAPNPRSIESAPIAPGALVAP